MSTEDIKVEAGHIKVERAGNKPNVDVPVSNVENVSFTRGVWDGPGTLVLHTKNGEIPIRVENDDAGQALKLVTGALKKEEKKQEAPKEESDKSSQK